MFMNPSQKPFTPQPFSPGAEIIWTHEYQDGTRKQRTGQCWSYAPNVHGSPTIWVVPDDGGQVVAVCKIRRGGRVYTQAGKAFDTGDIFSESHDLSPTGSITAGAWHAMKMIRDQKARSALAAAA